MIGVLISSLTVTAEDRQLVHGLSAMSSDTTGNAHALPVPQVAASSAEGEEAPRRRHRKLPMYTREEAIEEGLSCGSFTFDGSGYYNTVCFGTYTYAGSDSNGRPYWQHRAVSGYYYLEFIVNLATSQYIRIGYQVGSGGSYWYVNKAMDYEWPDEGNGDLGMGIGMSGVEAAGWCRLRHRRP